MRKRFIALIILALLISGCGGKRIGQVIRTPDGIELQTNEPAKITYKDGKGIEAEMDSREPSLLEDIIKLWGIKQIERQ